MSRLITDDAAKELTAMAVNSGFLTQANFDKISSVNKESGQSVVSILFEKALMDEYSLAKFVADSYGLHFQEIDAESINEEAQNKLSPEYIQLNLVFPFAIEGSTLRVAICDQSKLNLEKNIKVMTGMNIEMVLVTVSNLESIFTKSNIMPAIAQEEVQGALGTLRTKKEEEVREEVVISEADKTDAELFVTEMLTDAYNRGCSDIHIDH